MAATPSRRCIALLALLLGLVSTGLMSLPAQAPKEPENQGKPLSAWVKQLTDPTPANRTAAAEAIRKFGKDGSPALDAILAAAKDTDSKVRAEAVLTLNHLPADPKAVPILIAALKDESPDVRLKTTYVLQRYAYLVPQSKAAIKPLLAAMEDSSPRVRSNAASALAGFGPAAKEGVPALTTALDDKDSSMRAGAALTLGRIGPEAKAATTKLIELLRAEPKAGEPKSLFEDVVRRNAAMALGRITRGTDVAVAPLIAALDDKGLEVGVYAAIALGEIGPAAKAAVGPLQGFIQTEKDARIRIHAAAALMRIDPQFAKSSIEILVAALTDERMFVRHNALTALEGLGPLAKEAMPALQKLLQDPNKAIQDDAARAIKKIDAEAAKKSGVK